MFGQGYTPRESVKLPPGEYFARINGCRYEQTKNGTPYLAVYVSIKDRPGARPNVMQFYDRPYAGDREKERWDEQWTELCDSFGLPRSVPQNDDYSAWKGKTGWVRCVPRKNAPEYSNLYPLRHPSGAEPEPDEYVPASDGANPPATDEEFLEDIPF